MLNSLDLSNNSVLEHLYISYMPLLGMVCLQDRLLYNIDAVESPNVYFTSGCTSGLLHEQIYPPYIYPNPTSDFFTLQPESPFMEEVEIHTLSGQLIHRQRIQSTSEKIDVTMYPKGIYSVTVRSGAQVRTVKLMKY